MMNNNKPHPGILINRIPVDGFAGFLFTVAVLLTFLIGIPAFQEFFVVALVAGAGWAGMLYYWRNQTRW